jgi:GTP-binding protein
LRVELQLLADIGLVGFPNAGKSSLLDRFSRARPKIAPYPFTTKIPNLGVLRFEGGAGDENNSTSILIADIPGLIEGASAGAGLGLQFLKHISRTQALVFLLDLSDEATWEGAYAILMRELEAFSAELPLKRRILVGSKLDLPGAAERLEQLKERHPEEEVYGISVFSGEGLPELSQALVRLAT